MARRHPAVMADYVADRKASEPRTRFLYRPLSRLPGAARVLASIAGRAGGLILRTRWRGSRAFARLFNAAGHIAFWSAFERETGLSSRRSVMVLCYHAIADHSADPVLAPYSVAPELFRRQIDWLRRRGHRFIAPQDLLDFLDGKAVPPRKAVLVTFDDCYRDLADTVRTELAPRGIPALAFCVAGIASNSNEWDRPRGARRLALLTAAELAALRGEGLEVGSHALTHRALTTLPRPEMARELGASVEALERAGLPRPRFLAYPYGDRDAATRVEARRAGFALAFGTDGSRVDRLSDRFDIPRVTMMASDRGLRLWLKIEAPGLLAWLVDRKAALRSRFT
jgi:peptidoglycan/xylan/chitin deacetylase (PgdA/CDA1 family)